MKQDQPAYLFPSPTNWTGFPVIYSGIIGFWMSVINYPLVIWIELIEFQLYHHHYPKTITDSDRPSSYSCSIIVAIYKILSSSKPARNTRKVWLELNVEIHRNCRNWNTIQSSSSCRGQVPILVRDTHFNISDLQLIAVPQSEWNSEMKYT